MFETVTFLVAKTFITLQLTRLYHNYTTEELIPEVDYIEIHPFWPSPKSMVEIQIFLKNGQKTSFHQFA